ncbi:MAG: hypothetical protein J6Y08_03955 [Clostridiales bacterium]|nr:hypothetical protein [Clostridiales bacterium]
MKKKITSIILTLALTIPACFGCAQEVTEGTALTKSTGPSEQAAADSTPPSTFETEEPTEPAPTTHNYMQDRPELREALNYHTDLIATINNGRLHEVDIVKEGEDSSFTLTLDSYLADPLAFCYFATLEGDFESDVSYYLQDCTITNADTGEELYIVDDPANFEKSGELSYGQIYWENACSNFDIDVSLVKCYEDYTERVLEDYHFEFRDVDLTPVKTFTLDRDLAVGDQTLHLRELIVGETCTQIRFDDIPYSSIHNVDMKILDANGEELATAVPYTYCGYSIPIAENDLLHVNVLASFYYSGKDDFSLYVTTCYAAFSDGKYIKIDSKNETAEYDGRTLDIIYRKHGSYSDYGLPACEYYDGLRSPIFLVPAEGLPVFNSTYDVIYDSFSYNGEDYPLVTIDGVEYIVIQCPDFFSDSDGCFYFIRGGEHEYYDIYEKIDLKLSEG